MNDAVRTHLRRYVFLGVIALQLLFVVRAYWAPHKEFGFQMFPEASSWQADIVRVTTDGQRVPVTESWDGYQWSNLVTDRGLAYPWVRHHADDGLDNQLAFLHASLDWVAANTPRDTQTAYYEATVTRWFNTRAPTTEVMRSPQRPLP